MGALTTFGLLWAGILLFLALISYTPNDVPSSIPFLSHTSNPNNPAHNLIGVVGAIVASFHYLLFGAGSYLVAVGLCWFGMARFVAAIPVNQRTIGGLVLLVISGASFAHLQPFFLQHWQETYNIGPGGSVGQLIGLSLQRFLGGFGAHIVLLPAYVFGLILLTGFHPWIFFRRLSAAAKACEAQKQVRWQKADELERIQIEERKAKKAIKTSKRLEKKRAKSGSSPAESSDQEESDDDDWEVVAKNAPPPEAQFDGNLESPAKTDGPQEHAKDSGKASEAETEASDPGTATEVEEATPSRKSSTDPPAVRNAP